MSSPLEQALTMTPEALEAAINELLEKKKVARAEASAPSEPNYATLTEEEAMNPGIYIPVIQHEATDYMNIKLADNEYTVVWASRDQRRIGQLEAEGYEPLRREHLSPSYAAPLKFDSEGLYIYQDVVALRVHKRILYGKRRAIQELSRRQLSPHRPNLDRPGSSSKVIQDSPALDAAFNEGRLGFY